MNLIEKLKRHYSLYKVKKNVLKKITQQQIAYKLYKDEEQKPLENYTSKLDSEIKNYLKKNKNTISGVDKGWYTYVYQMIEELLNNGLTNEDVIGYKEKYATFRCYIQATTKEKQYIFDKIINTYTNVINTRCQFCDNAGVIQSIEGWDFNLCLKHYLKYKYDLSVDDSIYNYKDYFGERLDKRNYKDVSNSLHSQIEEQYLSIYISMLKHYLEKQESISLETIRVVLKDYFMTLNDIWERDDVLSIDNKKYKVEINFIDEEGNRIMMPDIDKSFQSKGETIRHLINKSF